MGKRAMAIAAHPDDIEFMMAGTLLLLKEAGYDIHYMTLSDGNCGSMIEDAETTGKLRIQESKDAADILGATYHPPICHDFEIFYDKSTLQNLVTTIREVEPEVILTHPPEDYMEDHMNTCRLVVSAAFVRGIPNYKAHGSTHTLVDCTVYHAMPHGLRGPLRRMVKPGSYIDVSSVYDKKFQALAAHKSQYRWLDSSQKMTSYLKFLEKITKEVGRMSGKFEYAEGWSKHLHYGFCSEKADPLSELGNMYLLNQEYEMTLTAGVG